MIHNADENESGSRIFETRTTKISLLNEFILLMEEKPNIEISLPDAIKNANIVNSIPKSNNWVILADIRKNNGIKKEARDYYAHQDTFPGRVANALLIHSYFSKVIANFFIGFSKPLIPSQIFTSQEEAIEWLEEIIG